MTDTHRDPSGPSDDPRTKDPAEPARRVIMARPVTGGAPGGACIPPIYPYAHAVGFARALPPSPIHLDMIWWKALLQVMTLFPFLAVGTVAAAFTAWYLGVADDAWFNVITGTGMGLGGLFYVLMQLHLSDAPADSIGWTFRDWTRNAGIGIATLLMFYCVAFVVAMVIIMLLARSNPEILTAEPESAQAIRETFPRMSLPALMLMMTFVAIWEEVVFRGFLLTRLRALVGRWWLAIFIGAILFSFGHIYQGLLGMFVTFILGLILGALFVWRKSLVPGIVYHICQNVLAFQMTQWLYAGAS